MREWRRALEIDPQNADIHDSLGDALLAQERQAEALAEWRAAIELRPNGVATPEKAAWLAPRRWRWRRGRCSTLSGRTCGCWNAGAAAYAEKGYFEYAESVEREALAAQGLENQPELAAQVRSRLAL
jgi:tetratricopeptide (TPR) repeat protein